MKKKLSLLMAVAMAFSLLAGCSSSTTSTTETTTAEATPEPDYLNEATANAEGAPEGVVAGSYVTGVTGTDMIAIQRPGMDASAGWMLMSVYDTLFWSPSGNWDDLTGLLVEDYVISDDSLDWTLTLHDNVTFTNGNPLTAESVKNSLEYIVAVDGNTVLDTVESIEVTGEYEVIFHLYAPNPEFMYGLGIVHTGIFDTTELLVSGESLDNYQGIGSGPYYISDYGIGDFITLTAKEDHWNADRQGHIETFYCKYISDNSAQLIALQSGELDIALISTYDSYETLQITNPDLQVITNYGSTTPYWMNLAGWGGEYLSNVRVREALVKLIDFEQVMIAATNGYGEVVNNAFNSAIEYDHSDLYYYAPEEGLAILEEEGIDPSDIVITPIVQSNAAAPYGNIQSQLLEYGIQFNYSATDMNAVTTAGRNGEWDVWNQSGGINRYAFVAPLTMGFGSAGNFNFIQDDVLDPICIDLIEQITVAADRDTEIDLVNELAQTLAENYTYLGNYRSNNWLIYNDRVKNVGVDQYIVQWRLWDSWVED